MEECTLRKRAPVAGADGVRLNRPPVMSPAERGGCPLRDARTTGAAMNLARSVSEVLREHVTLEIEGIDRMYLNAYVPRLQNEMGVVHFFRWYKGYAFA